MNKITVKERYSSEYKPIIRGGGELRLSYRSSTGKFNMLGNEVSTLCYVTVFEDDRILSRVSIDVENEYEGDDIDEILWLIDEDKKMHWIDTASEKKQAMRNFISVNREAIERGNSLKEIELLTKEIAQKAERLEYLSRIFAPQTT